MLDDISLATLAELAKSEESGLMLFVTNPTGHRVDVGWDRAGQAQSSGSFLTRDGGSEGVRLERSTEGENMTLHWNRHNGYSAQANTRYLYASAHRDRRILHSEPPSIQEFAESRDRVLNNLANQGYLSGS